MMSLSLVVLFLLFVVMGLPIAMAMGLAAGAVVWFFDMPLTVLAQRTINSLDSTPLLAVPMFIFAAAIFNNTGITSQLFDFCRMLIGRIRGGLGHVTVVTHLVFSGVSGAALADIGALGSIQIRMMRAQGYKDEFSAGICMAASTLGPIFPPSIPLVIFAMAAETSPVKPLLAPVVLIGGLVIGIFGSTEAAAVTVVYALLVGLFVYRSLTWKGMVDAARETVQSSANVMFIVGSAAIFAYVLTLDQVPMRATEWFLSVSKDPTVLLMIVNVLLLLVGMIMESIAAILIIAPIITPALVAAGVDPAHLGVVVVLNLMIGLMTPPVGMSLYMVANVAKMPLERVVVSAWPWIICLTLSLLAVTLLPAASTWLPNLIMN